MSAHLLNGSTIIVEVADNIIANSSFSWWGAWLNQNREKVVIAPKKWLNMEECHFTLPASWIKS